MNTIRTVAAALILVASGLMNSAAHAEGVQLGGVRRVDLLQRDLSVAGREVLQVLVKFSPGIVAPRHSHPGEEIVYVVEGALEYQLDGQPPVTVKAGESLFIPSGTAHAVKNVGSGDAAELATYIVEKGKPLVTLTK